MGPVRVDAVCGSFSKFFVLIVLANVIGPGGLLASQVTANSSSSPQLPLLFEQNNGQFNDYVVYFARGKGYSIVLGQQPVIELYRFGSAAGAQGADLGENPVEGVRGSVEIESVARIRLNILGARADSAATPLERQQALTNYLTGDPSDWKTGIPNFTRVRYSGVLPDIDVEYYGRDGRLEYDFVVHPGGDPGSIKFSIEGAQGISVNEQHDLVIDLGGHHIVQRAPVSWQLASNGEKISIPSAYSVEGDVVRLEVAAWDADKILVIDPVLEYSAYYGGAANDEPLAIDLDSSGNIYVISLSRNNGLGTLGTLKPTNTSERVESISEYNCGDCTDAVSGWVDRRHLTKLFTSILVTKFSPDGKNVLFATYFNGNPAQDLSLGVNSAAVSAAGEVAFGIFTNNVALRAGLPTPNAAQAHSPSQQNVYVAKLNNTGTALVFGTYLQIGDTTSSTYFLRGLDVSAAGKVAVTGMSSFNSGFPELNPIAGQSCALTGPSENSDGFVALFSATGTLEFASCLGGTDRAGTGGASA